MESLNKTSYIYKISNGSVSDYVTSIYGREKFCTCPYFLYHHKTCKHLKELYKELGEEMKLNIRKPAEEFDSSLGGLNNLFNGNLYNSREIVGLYGKPNIGKSLFATQESFYQASNGRNVLYIDTEGSAESMLTGWAETFEERFGGGSGEITLVSKLELKNLVSFLGYSGDIVQKKGKVEFRIGEPLKSSEFENSITKENIDFVVLDSITSPIRRFTNEQQNFPARASFIAFVMTEIIKMMENYDLGVLVTNHATWNPAALPHEKGIENIELTGGVITHHYLKRILYIDRRGTTAAKNYRRFWLVRSESNREFSKASVALINNDGFHDVDDESIIKNMFTAHELTLLE